jgi:hypothetical protein
MTGAVEDAHFYKNTNWPLNSLGTCAQLQREAAQVPVPGTADYVFDGSGTYGCDTVNGNTTAHVDGKLMWRNGLDARYARVRVNWQYADGTQQVSVSPRLDRWSTSIGVTLKSDRLRDVRAYSIDVDTSQDGSTYTQFATSYFDSHFGSYAGYSSGTSQPFCVSAPC